MGDGIKEYIQEDIHEISGLIQMYQATGEKWYEEEGLKRAADAVFSRLENDNENEKTEQIMPFYAEYSTRFRQKAHYGEIAAFFEEKKTWSGRDVAALIDTIEKMSMEIYEYYRALCDLFKQVIRSGPWLEAANEAGPVSDQEAEAGYAVLKACNLGVLNREKYGEAGNSIWKRYAVQHGIDDGAEAAGENGDGTAYEISDGTPGEISAGTPNGYGGSLCNRLKTQYLILKRTEDEL